MPTRYFWPILSITTAPVTIGAVPHSIAALQAAIRTLPDGQRILGDADFAFLDEYAIDAPYEGVQEPLPDEYLVLESIRSTVSNMMAFIAADSGEPLPTYTPPGPRR